MREHVTLVLTNLQAHWFLTLQHLQLLGVALRDSHVAALMWLPGWVQALTEFPRAFGTSPDMVVVGALLWDLARWKTIDPDGIMQTDQIPPPLLDTWIADMDSLLTLLRVIPLSPTPSPEGHLLPPISPLHLFCPVIPRLEANLKSECYLSM